MQVAAVRAPHYQTSSLAFRMAKVELRETELIMVRLLLNMVERTMRARTLTISRAGIQAQLPREAGTRLALRSEIMELHCDQRVKQVLGLISG